MQRRYNFADTILMTDNRSPREQPPSCSRTGPVTGDSVDRILVASRNLLKAVNKLLSLVKLLTLTRRSAGTYHNEISLGSKSELGFGGFGDYSRGTEDSIHDRAAIR